MNSLQRQERIVEKVLKTKAGQYVRAVFLVYEVNGNLEARLISACPITNSRFQPARTESARSGGIPDSKFTKTIVCLPVIKENSTQAFANTKYSKTTSPYFNIFSFFTSQPTRAPSA